MDKQTKRTIDDLNSMHDDAKSLDKESLAEMRSAILLIAGEHYSRRMTEWLNRGKSQTGPSAQESQKLRITKNWLHKAHRLYVASIIGQSPGTACSPRNPTELQDQKDAELNQSVWEYFKSKYKLKAHYRDMASDFCGVGECATKIYFDPGKGYLKGYEQQVDEDGTPQFETVMEEQQFADPVSGMPYTQMVPAQGAPIPDESKPVFSGEFVFERLYAQNIFRDPNCRQMKNAQWIGVETLTDTKTLKSKYKDDKDKLKYIETSDDEYIVFDSNKAGYSKEKNQCVLREFYFKSCREYPKGYYFVTTKSGILEEGELPGGIWPIIWQGFDEHPTKPRATGIVKVARPWQAEINRASSQIAMHQVTISEDKILYQSGTKVSQGALLPGVRGLTYQGAPPTILPGRAGDQYFQYLAMQEEELNRALMIDILDAEKLTNLDPMALLFRTMSQTQKFSLYSEKFGEFLIQLTETALELAKFYLPDDEVIAAVGRAEQINLAEFRKTTPLCHRIHVEEQNDTIETKLGRQLVANHILQYVGTQMQREDIGKLITEMPFGNWKDAFADFTMDSKNVKNDFLAMERGEQPKVSPRDDSTYVLKQVAKRMKERDFSLLPPQVQQLYAQYEQYHEAKMSEEAAALKAAQDEFVPVGGAMIACDMYVPADDPSKAPKRVRVPYQALDWLVKTLEVQGMGMDKMEQMNDAQVMEVTKGLLSGQGGQLPSAG